MQPANTLPSSPLPSIEPADLEWHEGVPESKQFGDIYFSRENGLEESRYVFIDHNNLPVRFATVPEAGAFVVAENGFGTGLNFLATWQAWNSYGPSHAATLHFISAERFPLTPQDLEKALSFWPELKELAHELIANYPPLVRGAHRLVLGGGRVRLTLYFGDLNDAWSNLRFKADAWFLDGFAPAVNPGAWQETAVEHIRQHSKPGTTLATFTAVGYIRRLLQGAGAQMQKTKGYGRKRDMLSGVFWPDSLPSSKATETVTPSVTIVRAGIAGCLLANNLAQRGYPVTLIDSASQAGAAASGNLQGALYVKLGVEFNAQTEFALSALTFSQRYYEANGGKFWHRTGLLQLAWNSSEEDRQRRFISRNQYPEDILYPVTKKAAEIQAGIPLSSGGLWFPRSGWLEPAELCRMLSAHPAIQTVYNFPVTQMSQSDGQWRLSGDTPEHAPVYTDSVVICAGHKTPEVIPGQNSLRFKAIRGQVTHLPDILPANPQAVICGARYLNPFYTIENQRQAVMGATFDLHDNTPEPTAESHQENLHTLSAMVPAVLPSDKAAAIEPEQLEGRTGFRCTTHDYQPVAGQFYDSEGTPTEGLYLLTGLGSKGLTYAPLLAEFLADEISGQPLALPASLIKRVATRRMHRLRTANK